ncbi:uncharacterized protein LOC135939006 [Cloeon dipterum]|uniref:Uncharacterized protein n=1 Tax=Cloeon dipterum TaxID=197152 RepID=A0A8S1D3Y3_9INSE|nr:Hypothetical predicted protein [Cloeon dipterum]
MYKLVVFAALVAVAAAGVLIPAPQTLAYSSPALSIHPSPLLRSAPIAHIAAPLAYSPSILRSSTAWGNAAWAPGVTYASAIHAAPALYL